MEYWDIEEVRFRGVILHGAFAGLLTHIAFLLIFYLTGATVLAVFNIGSVLLFASCIPLVKRGREQLAAMLVQTEVVCHAALAVWYLGWDSGFHYYIFCLVPLAFIRLYGSLAQRIAFVGCCTVLYVALDHSAPQISPVIVLDPPVLDTLRAFNIVGSFAILGYLILFLREVVSNAEKRLEEMARLDELSGLYNRRIGIELINQEISRIARTGSSLSFVLADIDHFKLVNDRYGHPAGDHVIAFVSEKLRANARESDIAIRWGGEEFLMVLTDTDGQAAHRIAERMRASIAGEPVYMGMEALRITVTFGVSEYVPGESIESCVARVDAALYEGKKSGRDQVMSGSPQAPVGV